MRVRINCSLSRGREVAFVWALICMALTHNVLIPLAKAQEKCETALRDAQRQYDGGHLTEVIALLRRCLPDSIPKGQRLDAYELLALAHLAEDNLEPAQEAIRNMLVLHRKYRPDSTKVSPRFIAIVKEMRQHMPVLWHERLFGGYKKWLWLVGGAGAIAGVLLPGEPPSAPEPSDLPLPPKSPDRR